MNTSKKIEVKENKILKLSNVLIRTIEMHELANINQIQYMMESYIKSKGTTIVGPLVNYTSSKTDEKGQVNLTLKLIVQTKNVINKVEKPYEFLPQLRVTNCLFARFMEKEQNLEYAYSKLNLYAFENDIKLKGDSYTVFADKKDDSIVADVFMEIKKGGDIVEGI